MQTCNLSKCFRCPKGHIEFNNELFKSLEIIINMVIYLI